MTPDEMRAIDRQASTPVEELIERAGAAVAREAIDMLGGSYGRTVAVVAGPGNNGADGRVAASRLRSRGVSVRVYETDDLPARLPAVDLVVDAAFGTGFHGSWHSPDVGGALVLAVDVPTGLDALTGEATEGTLRANRTITFAAAKPGMLFGDGPAHVGRVVVADIGLPVDDAAIHIVQHVDVAGWMPSRPRDSHKWSDAVRVVAGGPGMEGSAHLASAAAQRCGAGMVTLSMPGADATGPTEVVSARIPPVDWAGELLRDLDRYHALVIGPGLGREEYTVPSIVRSVFESMVPVVVDGDGLFALSWNDDGAPTFLLERQLPTVLTPHDGEFGLLTGARPDDDRIGAAHQLVGASGAVVLLKGPTTVVASPDGTTWLITNGDERLATAGTGDVLSGSIGSLLAQGLSATHAAAAGAWIHADAANRCDRYGMIASDLITAIPSVLDSLLRRHSVTGR